MINMDINIFFNNLWNLHIAILLNKYKTKYIYIYIYIYLVLVIDNKEQLEIF